MQFRASRPPEPQLVLKAIIVGDSGVGKSCLGLRCVGQPCRASHDITIGVEFLSSTLSVDGRLVKVHIWDTAGQESFRAITRSYYRTASLCFLVYDVTDAATFAHLRQWHADVRAHAAPSVVVAVVGNKTDLTARRVVSSEDAGRLAEELGALYFETSAWTGDGVREAFHGTLAHVVPSQPDDGGASVCRAGLCADRRLLAAAVSPRSSGCC